MRRARRVAGLLLLALLGDLKVAPTRLLLAVDGHVVTWRVSPATVQESARTGSLVGSDPGGDDVTVTVFAFTIISGTDLGTKSGLASGVYRTDRIHRIAASPSYMNGTAFGFTPPVAVSATPWARNLTVSGTQSGFTATVDVPNHIFNNAGELVRDGLLLQPSQLTFSWRIGPAVGSPVSYGPSGSGAGVEINPVEQTDSLAPDAAASRDVAISLPGYAGGLLSIPSGGSAIAAAPRWTGSGDADNHPGIVSSVLNAAVEEAAGRVKATVNLKDRTLVDGAQMQVGNAAPYVPARTLTLPVTHPAALETEVGAPVLDAEASEDAGFGTLVDTVRLATRISPTATLPGLLEGVTAYWRVRATYPTGATTQKTSPGIFVLDEHPPQVPTVAWHGTGFSGGTFDRVALVNGAVRLAEGGPLDQAVATAEAGLPARFLGGDETLQTFSVLDQRVRLRSVRFHFGGFRVRADPQEGAGVQRLSVTIPVQVFRNVAPIGIDVPGRVVAEVDVQESAFSLGLNAIDLSALGVVLDPGKYWLGISSGSTVVTLGNGQAGVVNVEPLIGVYDTDLLAGEGYTSGTSIVPGAADWRFEIRGDPVGVPQGGVYVSPPQMVESGLGAVAMVNAIQVLPAGTAVSYELRGAADVAGLAAAPYLPVTLGQGVNLSGVGALQWRASLHADATLTQSPAVRQFVVTMAPVPFSGLGPANGALATVAPVLRWQPGFDNLALDRYEVVLDTQSVQVVPAAGPLQMTGAVDLGTHTWSVRAVDRAGNVSAASPATFVVPLFEPTTPALVSPLSGTFARSPVTFQWTGIFAGRGLVRYELLLDSATVSVDPGAASTARTLAEGFHVWTVRAVDVAGSSTTAPPARGVFVDTTPPAVAVDVTALVMDTTPAVTVQVTESTGGSGLTAQNLAAATWRLESPTVNALIQQEISSGRSPQRIGLFSLLFIHPQSFTLLSQTLAPLSDGTTQAVAAALQTAVLPNALLSFPDVTMVVTVGDRAGNFREVRTRLPTPRVGPVTAAPAAFSPNGDGLLEVTTVSYAARLAQPTQVQIVNSASVTVRSGLEDARIIREGFAVSLGSIVPVAGEWSVSEVPGRLTSHVPFDGTDDAHPVALARVGTPPSAELTLSATVGMELAFRQTGAETVPEQWVGYWLWGEPVASQTAPLDPLDPRLQRGVFVRIFQPAAFSGTLLVQAFGLDVRTGVFTKVAESPLLLSETTVQTTAGGPLGTIVSVRVSLRVTLAGDELLVRANSRVSLALDLVRFGLSPTTAPVYLVASVVDGALGNRAVFDDVTLIPGQASVVWDGKNTSGAVVADGAYTVRVTTGPGGSVLASTSVVVDATPPTAVTSLTATARPAGNIDLAWSAATDVLSPPVVYQVWRATVANAVSPLTTALATLVTETTALTVTQSGGPLTDGVTVYFTVAPRDQLFNTRLAGNATAFAVPDKIPPTAPTGLGVADVPADQGGALRLSWAANTESDLTDYRIRRSTGSGITLGTAVLVTVAASGTTHQDAGLTDLTTYYYRLTARDASLNESGLSVDVSAFPVDNSPPVAVSNGAIVPGSFNPSLGEVTRISYVLNKAATVTVQVGATTILTSTPRPAGLNTEIWNGQIAGTTAANGTYAVTITGTAGAQISTFQAPPPFSVTVASNRPVVTGLTVAPDPVALGGTLTVGYTLAGVVGTTTQRRLRILDGMGVPLAPTGFQVQSTGVVTEAVALPAGTSEGLYRLEITPRKAAPGAVVGNAVSVSFAVTSVDIATTTSADGVVTVRRPPATVVTISSVPVATAPTAASFALQTQALTFQGPLFYNLTATPAGPYTPPLQLAFATPAGLDAGQLDVRRFNAVTSTWDLVAGQIRDAVQGRIVAPVTTLSLFGLFARPPDTVPPASVASVTGFPGPGVDEVTLLWTAVGNDGTVGSLAAEGLYDILEGSGPIETAALIDSAVATEGPGGQEDITVDGFPSGVPVFLRIVAEDRAGNRSPPSPFAAVDRTPPITRLALADGMITVFAEDSPVGVFVSGVATTTVRLDGGGAQVVPTPFVVPVGTRLITLQSIDRAANMEVAHTHVAFPVTNLRATAGVHAVHLLWTDPGSAGDFTQAYEVERATDVNNQPGFFVALGAGADEIGTPRWADRGLTPGTPYWYRIITRMGGGFASLPSTAIRATPTLDVTPPGLEAVAVTPTPLTTSTDTAKVTFRLTEAATWQMTVRNAGGAVVRTLVSRGFTDDFGDGQDDGWEALLGIWAVDRGVYHGLSRGAGASREEISLTVMDHFRDLVYETTVTIHPGGVDQPGTPVGGVQLLFRVQPPFDVTRGLSDAYWFDLNPLAPFVGFGRITGGRRTTPPFVSSAPVTLELGRPYAVRIEATSGTLRGFLDGRLVAEQEDAAFLGPGRLGLQIFAEEGPGEAAFGPVRVLAAGSTLAWDGRTDDPSVFATDGRYTIQVTAADLVGNQRTQDLGQVLLDRTPPTPVTTLVAMAQPGGGIALTWAASMDAGSGVSAYDIRRATPANLLTMAALRARVGVPGFVDGPAGLTHNVTYFYVVEPVDGVGHTQTVGNLVASAVSDQIPPAAVTDLQARFLGPNPGDLTLTWTSPGDDGAAGDLVGVVEIHVSPTLPVASEVVAFTTAVAAGAPIRVVVTGLAEGVTHYVAVRALDEVGNAAPLSAPVSVRYVVARSPDGQATVISDTAALGILVTSTATQSNLGQVAVSTGLVLVGAIYDIQPDTAPFTPPLVVTIVYSTPLPSGVAEADLAMFQFSAAAAQWVRIPDQTLDTANHRLIARIQTLTSLVGVFGRDRIPPVAALLSPDPRAMGVGTVVSGLVPVTGTVADDRHLTAWRVEVATGVAPAVPGPFTVVLARTQPVTAGTLGVWDTRSSAGPMTVRLTAEDGAGNITRSTAAVFVGAPALVQTLGPEVAGLGGEDAAPTRMHHPEAADIGADGTRWVADTGRDRVLAFRADGTLRLVVGALDDELRVASDVVRVALRLKAPGGIKALANGGVVVADTGQHRLVMLSSAGVVQQALGRTDTKGAPKVGAGLGEFNHPRGVDVDGAGNLYVADTENHRFQVLSATGTSLLTVALPRVPELDDGDDVVGVGATSRSPEEDAQPIGIVRERTGNRVYVSERESGQVFIFTLDPGVRPSTATLTGTLGGGPGAFQAPWHLAGTAQGHVYVAERNANRIRKFDRFGAEALAFGHGPGKAGGQEAAPTRMNKPTGVGVGPGGELAVAVRNDDRVKIFDAPAIQPVLPRPPPSAAPKRPAHDLSELGPPHDFVVGPNPARAGAPVNVYFVTGWSNIETEARVYTAAGEPVTMSGGEGGQEAAPTRPVPWGAPGYAPGRYALALAPRNASGESLASGVYLLQIKVRNPDTGEVVPVIKKVVVIR